MATNTDKSRADSLIVDYPFPGEKSRTKHPSTAGVVRLLKKDLKEDYMFLKKTKGVKEIRVTKIDKKERIIHLWIHKQDREGIPKIMSLFTRYPFKYMRFDIDRANKYLLKSVVAIDPTETPKGIVVLN